MMLLQIFILFVYICTCVFAVLGEESVELFLHIDNGPISVTSIAYFFGYVDSMDFRDWFCYGIN